MHELGLMREVVDRATAAAAGGRVCSIRLRVGRLSGADPDALRFCFAAAAADTPAAGAALAIEEVPVVCRCGGCGTAFEPAGWVFDCPACGELSTDVRQGTELELDSLEVS